MGAAHRSPRRLWRAGTGFVLGLLLLAVGLGIGLGHLLESGVGLVSVLGLIALVCGAGLVATAGFAIVRATPSWWRLLAVPALLAVAVLVVYILAVPLRVAVPARAAPPDGAPGGVADSRSVTFATQDGERLAGWYAPSSTGAAVVLLPGPAAPARRSAVTPRS